VRRFYAFVLVSLFACIVIFLSSFVYLDKTKRVVYNYTVNLDGYDIGTERLEKFVTEDKRLYKSVSEIPLNPLFTSSRSRIVMDRGYNLESYSKEDYGFGGYEKTYLENRKEIISFLTLARSDFAYLDNIQAKKDSFVFEEDSPITYLPILENYNFRRGRSQGFNAITPLSLLLPPMKRFVTLTSVRDEYLDIDSKRIKTECLLLKIRNYPQGIVWVSKLDRSLVMLEIPAKRLKITRSFQPKQEILADEYGPISRAFTEREASFKGRGVKLAGTLTVPKEKGVYPGILLIWDDGPQDRDYEGLFASIAYDLAGEGFVILRFDKRGIGLSGGDAEASKDSDMIGDLNAALDYLKGQQEVDRDKIYLIGHSKGSFYASNIVATRDDIRGLILMAPMVYSNISKDQELPALKDMAVKSNWSEEYLKTVMKSRVETINKLTDSKRSWLGIMGKRCFLDKMREELDERPLEAIRKIKIPVLILQGKEDDVMPSEHASIMDKALEEAGNREHTLTYFSYLGHLFGERINDGVGRIRYELDSDAAAAMKNWLKNNMASIPPAPKVAAPDDIAPKNK